MSKVNFKHQEQQFGNVIDCYVDNAEEMQSLCAKLKDKDVSECAKVYCELKNGIWDEDNLGKFKGELYADVFEKYLLLSTNPYRCQKYCACHNPYSDRNQTEEEFDNENLMRAYINEVMNDYGQYTQLFYYYIIKKNEIEGKQKNNE